MNFTQNKDVKIILVGYMGSGKTTLGKLLSKQLNINFLDLDDHIESLEGTTISQLFKEKGEVYFRKKEIAYLKEILSSKESLVLSTGGGTPCFGTNMDTINNATPNTYYIKVSLKELVSRLSLEKTQRPMIARFEKEELAEFIGKHLFERSYYYNKATHNIVADGKSPEEIVTEIISLSI
ncbi:shikimate kinase [Maribacter sp. 2304DJ31-5]|uniref:shikimate kinase n=1 Tax=Maribacter sp. 2304DJ31-5 TaxID=3386273 RepID=UPI0039BCC7E2